MASVRLDSCVRAHKSLYLSYPTSTRNVSCCMHHVFHSPDTRGAYLCANAEGGEIMGKANGAVAFCTLDCLLRSRHFLLKRERLCGGHNLESIGLP